MWQPQGYQFTLYNPVRQIYYYALAPLDEGGFGQVWDGIDGVGMRIAIKIIKPSGDALHDFIAWHSEQDVCLRCLFHPHIVTTFDQFMTTQGDLVIIMERADGSLRSLIQTMRAIDPWAVCVVGSQLSSSLTYVHNINIVHRDVTVNNILWFQGGAFKLADFGISHQLANHGDIARTLIGRKWCVAPELLSMGYTNSQSDIYQLGLALLTMLTGQAPIPDGTPDDETHRLILDGVQRQIAESLVGQHGALAEIVAKMLRRRPAFRYQRAEEVWADLYREAERRQQLSQLLQWAASQQNPQLPPWLTNSGV